MQRASDRKLILITREVRLQALLRRFNTKDQARFYVESRGQQFEDYEAEAQRYASALQKSVLFLQSQGMVQTLDRAFLPNFIFGPDDLILCLGQDGLVANTLKYTTGQPVVGINPDPDRYDGVLLPAKVTDLSKLMPSLLANRVSTKNVTFAEAALNDGRTFYAVNDFFIGPRTHISARYEIHQGFIRENQSSSGVIVSTGMGATGWLTSLVTGATSIALARGAELPPRTLVPSIPWDAEYLMFTVREPFPSRVSTTNLVFGEITRDSPLTLSSQMSENGVLFSDGVEADALEFNAGSVATIQPAKRQGKIVVAW